MTACYHTLEIAVPDKMAELLAGFLAPEVRYGWEEENLANGMTVLRVHCEKQHFLKHLEGKIREMFPEASFRFGEYEQKDWLEAWKEFFTPVFCGSRFVALPPWLRDMDAEGRQKILIEPKSAFGTGHHASTALCLTALGNLLDEERLRAGESFLDLGCGSGILGIAAALSGMRGMAIDNDSLALENTGENMALNDVQELELACGSVEKAEGRSFDLVMANILAQPLIDMAPAIHALLKPSGCLVLSGILDRQADAVEEAYKKCGMGHARRLAADEWRALVWA